MALRRYYSPKKDKPTGGRILVLDIETAPVLGNVWSLWQQNVGLNQIDRDWYILSFAAKWLGEDAVIYHDQSRSKDIENDKAMLQKLWVLLDEADIIVAHNGKRFDVKKINARFILNGLKPPSPYKIVDTMLIAKAQFAFTSNRLEYLVDKLNTRYKKLSHSKYPGFSLWRAVMDGDKKAWAEMREYNEHDVLATEELYFILRPWDKMHPNVAVYNDDETPACRVCGGHHLHKRGTRSTNVGVFDRYHCQACGAWSAGRVAVNTKEKRKGMLGNA